MFKFDTWRLALAQAANAAGDPLDALSSSLDMEAEEPSGAAPATGILRPPVLRSIAMVLAVACITAAIWLVVRSSSAGPQARGPGGKAVRRPPRFRPRRHVGLRTPGNRYRLDGRPRPACRDEPTESRRRPLPHPPSRLRSRPCRRVYLARTRSVRSMLPRRPTASRQIVVGAGSWRKLR